MCGRYIITAAPEALRRLFAYGEQPNLPPRYNVAPTQPVPVVIHETDIRQFRLMRWGFVPAWVKDPRTFSLIINARSETILDKPSFRNAIKRRRCLLPADGYYEWQASSSRKRPFFIHRRDGAPMGLAGVYETWAGPHGEEVDTVAIVTAAAAPDMAMLHDRVPVTIEPPDFDCWLDSTTPMEAILDLMVAPTEGTFAWHEVSAAVNRVANDSADLIVPLNPQEIAAADEAAKIAAVKSAPVRKAAAKSAPPEKNPAGNGQGELF